MKKFCSCLDGEKKVNFKTINIGNRFMYMNNIENSNHNRLQNKFSSVGLFIDFTKKSDVSGGGGRALRFHSIFYQNGVNSDWLYTYTTQYFQCKLFKFSMSEQRREFCKIWHAKCTVGHSLKFFIRMRHDDVEKCIFM